MGSIDFFNFVCCLVDWWFGQLVSQSFGLLAWLVRYSGGIGWGLYSTFNLKPCICVYLCFSVVLLCLYVFVLYSVSITSGLSMFVAVFDMSAVFFNQLTFF